MPARGCSEPGSLHIVPEAWRVPPAHFYHEGVFPPDTGCSEPGIPYRTAGRACPARALSPMRIYSHRTRDARSPASHIRVPEAWHVPPAHLQCGCVPTDHCCGVTHVRFIACASTVVALRQSGGGCLAGRRSQCAMYLLPLRSLCRCSRRQSARRDPAVPCVLCSAHTRVSASPARTSRCRVWPLHRVHGLASLQCEYVFNVFQTTLG